MHLIVTDSNNSSIEESLRLEKDTKLCIFDYSDDFNVISLSKYIDENSDDLRFAYLDFIESLAYKKIGNVKIIDFLKIQNNYSFWFSGSLYEKSIYKQNYTDAIRLMALEKIIKKNHVKKISISIKSNLLTKSISEMCNKLDIFINILNKSRTFKIKDLKKNYIFIILKSLFVFISLSLRSFKHTNYPQNENGIIFIAPFSYLNTDIKNNELKFKSNLWDGIPELFLDKDISANFLHIFSPHPDIKTPKQASYLIDLLNTSNKSNHFLLDCNLELKDKVSIFYLWLKTLTKFSYYISPKENFDLKSSNINLFHILRDNYFDTFFGPNLIYNLFTYEYIKKKIELLNNQKKSFYLYENQGWENMISHVIKNTTKSQIFAVPHSTTRFWDLRHYHSAQWDVEEHPALSNSYLVNSPYGKEHYTKNGYKESALIECEALRYQRVSLLHKEQKEQKDKSNSLLVFLDYSPSYTNDMMKFLQDYEYLHPNKYNYVFKPHINSPIHLSNYNFQSAKIFNGDINIALDDHNICLCSNMTSAQVDAYTYGLKVLVFHDGRNLNLSPMSNNKEVHFIHSFKDFEREMIMSIGFKKIAKDYFYINKNLQKWSSILFDKV